MTMRDYSHVPPLTDKEKQEVLDDLHKLRDELGKPLVPTKKFPRFPHLRPKAKE